MRSGKNWQSGSRPRWTHRRALVLLILALTAVATSPAQIVELPREDSTAGDFFGAAVAIDGDFVIVGATGVNGCGPNSGAAYIYERVAGSEAWSQSAHLQPSDCEAEIFFGRSVDLSGRFAAVAASREFFSEEAPNAVYVFERDTLSGAWHEVAKLTGGREAEEGAFATSLSLDGERVLVTTSGDPAGGSFGGVAYVFERNVATGSWEQSARLQGNQGSNRGIFGTAGALEGNLIAVAASTYFRGAPGSVYIFEHADSRWSETARVGEVEDFFISLDVDSARVLAGESKAMRNASGSATIFERDATNGWTPTHVLTPTKPYDAGAFGSEVALHGEHAFVVGFDEQLGLDFNIDRVVFVFRYDSSTESWKQIHVIDVGEVAFGADLDVYGRYAAIGRAAEDEPGSVYIVQIPEYNW